MATHLGGKTPRISCMGMVNHPFLSLFSSPTNPEKSWVISSPHLQTCQAELRSRTTTETHKKPSTSWNDSPGLKKICWVKKHRRFFEGFQKKELKLSIYGMYLVYSVKIGFPKGMINIYIYDVSMIYACT